MTQPQAQSAEPLGPLIHRLMVEAREHKRQEQIHRRAAQEKRQQIDALRGILHGLGIELIGTAKEHSQDGQHERHVP